MKWKKLSEKAFPDDVVKAKNFEFTDIDDDFHTHTDYYQDKRLYIIAMDTHHMPQKGNCHHCQKKTIDDRYMVCIFHAKRVVTTDDITGKIIREKKYFDYGDKDGWMRIPVDDENIGYCKYKMVEIEDITD